MTFEEFEGASDEDLTWETKRCFDTYNDPQVWHETKPALLLEAQFYIQELGRREDARVAKRDYGLEIWVIILIGIEILLSVGGIALAIKQGKDEDALMTKQNIVLSQLNTNMAATGETLQTSLATMKSMNDRLGVELGRMSQITVDFLFSGTKASISNQGNVDLQFWGFKVADMQARLNKQPVLLKRSASVEIHGIVNDIHKASTGDLVQLYVRDDFNNEFVAEKHMQLGPNVGGYVDRFQVVQRRWSNK